jgi:hypothetical protein
VEITFDDEVKALILLSSLPESWSAVVTGVSSSLGHGKLQLNDIRDLILSEDIRRKERGAGSALTAGVENRGRSQQSNSKRTSGR